MPDFASILLGNGFLLSGEALFAYGTSRYIGRHTTIDVGVWLVALLSFVTADTDPVTDVLTISGPVGSGNDFTVAFNWGTVDPTYKKLTMGPPEDTQVGTDPTKPIGPDNPAVIVTPMGKNSTDALYKVNNGSVETSRTNQITVGGLPVELLSEGSSTLTIEALSSVVGNGDAGNAGSSAANVSDSLAYASIYTPGVVAITWSSVGGNAGKAQQGGSGGMGGAGGDALADTAPVIFFMPFPPITAPSTQSISMDGGVGGRGAQGGLGGVGGLGGAGGDLDLTLSADDAVAKTIASLSTTGGEGGYGRRRGGWRQWSCQPRVRWPKYGCSGSESWRGRHWGHRRARGAWQPG